MLGAFLTGTGPPDGPGVAGLAAAPGLDPPTAPAALAAADLVHSDPARRAHPGMTATRFDQAEAVEAAGQAFGGPLDRPNPQEITP